MTSILVAYSWHGHGGLLSMQSVLVSRFYMEKTLLVGQSFCPVQTLIGEVRAYLLWCKEVPSRYWCEHTNLLTKRFFLKQHVVLFIPSSATFLMVESARQ